MLGSHASPIPLPMLRRYSEELSIAPDSIPFIDFVVFYYCFCENQSFLMIFNFWPNFLKFPGCLTVFVPLNKPERDICIYIQCAASCVSATALSQSKGEWLLGKKGERSPIFKLEWKCTSLSHALQVLKVQWWSFDQAAKINEMSMKNE